MAQKKKNAPHKTVLQRLNGKEQQDNIGPLTPKQILAAKCIDPLDVIEVLKISTGTFYNWWNQGLIPLIKLNRRTYVDLADLLIVLNSMKQWGKGKQK